MSAWQYRGPTPEEAMALIRLPCDPPAAAALVEDRARGELARAVFAAVFSLVAAGMGLLALGILRGPGGRAPQAFLAVFLVATLLFIGVGIAAAASGWRRHRELKGLARAIAWGMLPREKYCGRSLLEAYYTFKAAQGAPGPAAPHP